MHTILCFKDTYTVMILYYNTRDIPVVVYLNGNFPSNLVAEQDSWDRARALFAPKVLF